MERLGNIFSHLSNGYKNLPELIPYSCSTHMHRVGSFTSTLLLCVLYISICKSSLIIHVHSLASGFSVSINFFFASDKKRRTIWFSSFFEKESFNLFPHRERPELKSSFSRISGNARKSLVCTRCHKNTMSKIQRLLQFYLQKTKDLLKINLLVWFQPRRVLYFENRAISTFIIFRHLTLKSRPGNLTHI